MTDRYILDGKKTIPEPDLMKWANWFEAANRRVAKTDTKNGQVSTVFLGLDHSFGDGPVQLFETLVFGGTLNDEQDRYSTWDDAVSGHKEMVQRVEAGEE